MDSRHYYCYGKLHVIIANLKLGKNAMSVVLIRATTPQPVAVEIPNALQRFVRRASVKLPVLKLLSTMENPSAVLVTMLLQIEEA